MGDLDAAPWFLDPLRESRALGGEGALWRCGICEICF